MDDHNACPHGCGYRGRLRNKPHIEWILKMLHISSYLAGLLFGVGLLVSGMSNPAKVIGFLDIFGKWDPSLALVMAGAVAVGLIAFSLAKRMSQSICGSPMYLPTTTRIDRRLVLGSVMFGIGWGLAGFCPGPTLVAVGAGVPKAFVFVLAMLAGMMLFNWFNKKESPSRQASFPHPGVDDHAGTKGPEA
jgi:uncharacterized membrane protein YedE/YeeE